MIWVIQASPAETLLVASLIYLASSPSLLVGVVIGRRLGRAIFR